VYIFFIMKEMLHFLVCYKGSFRDKQRDDKKYIAMFYLSLQEQISLKSRFDGRGCLYSLINDCTIS
jgi:hypothetical protein